MRIAILSDIHGNIVALRSVLDALGKLDVQRIVFLGDAVGYLPHAHDVINVLRDIGAVCLRGNHEELLLRPTVESKQHENAYRHNVARETLTKADLATLANWPEQLRFDDGDSDILLAVHGSVTDPLFGYLYPQDDLSEQVSPAADADVVVMGHTHHPFARREGKIQFINAGSVGLPRDQGNLSSFAVYDTQTHTGSILRVAFDVEAVLAGPEDVHPSVRDVFFRTSDSLTGDRIV